MMDGEILIQCEDDLSAAVNAVTNEDFRSERQHLTELLHFPIHVAGHHNNGRL